MRIKFCGAAGTTTGSQHLLEVNSKKILLDCGLYQGKRKNSIEKNKKFYFDPKEIDSVILSHAHIDHSGNLPNLIKQGFNGNIYATHATRNLCQIMLADSARIQSYDAEFLNRKSSRKNIPPIEPLYNEFDAEKTMHHFIDVGYHRRIIVTEGVYLTFYDAGHILGSAQILLEIEDKENGKEFRLLFSGDVGREHNDILKDPEVVEDVDYVIMESTYGNRLHDQDTQVDDNLVHVINESIDRGGKIIIPSFAVERTQQLIYSLNKLYSSEKIKDIPIYVDSPLAVNATEIFRLHPECFNKEVNNFLHENHNPFGFEHLTLVRKVSKSKELNLKEEPMIVISSSGMCEAGRILHHLKNNIENPLNTILFVGYCAVNTLGWKIRNNMKKVRILGDSYNVKAQIEIFDSYSGHADQQELLSYFKKITGKKKKVFLVHGELEQSSVFAKILEENTTDCEITIAKPEMEVFI